VTSDSMYLAAPLHLSHSQAKDNVDPENKTATYQE